MIYFKKNFNFSRFLEGLTFSMGVWRGSNFFQEGGPIANSYVNL